MALWQSLLCNRIRWFWHHVKNQVVGSSWIIHSEDLQMTFGITAATKTGDEACLHIGEWTDNAPRRKLIFVGHEYL